MPVNKPITFIKALLQPGAYPHPVETIELRETHISWVLLTGQYAYKIKKPVNFGFLDFSTLEKRRFFCTEEVRINRRLAPELYLDVVAICGQPAHPQLGGEGEPMEYAVKMRQFDTRQGFDELLARGELTLAHMDETAQVLAAFHASIDSTAETSTYGTPAAIHEPTEENFVQLQQLDKQTLTPELHQQLATLQQWSDETYQALLPVFAERKQQGFIRECHGDLHLRNITLWQGRVTPFDGIEFNANLRWIDVISELAFLLMDLDDHRRHDLAQHLLNAYLEITGDYTGLAVLRFYQLYRAMVRAKVAGLRLVQTAFSDEAARQEMENYIGLAASYARPQAPRLIINHGLSGSGKTFVSQQLLEKTSLIRLRSDVERKRLFGLGPGEASGSGINTGIYQAAASERCYQHLLDLAEQLLGWGYSVLVDAAFLKLKQREAFAALAKARGIPFLILHCEASPEIQRQRIEARSSTGHDASEADLAILQQQLKTAQALSTAERKYTITLDTTQSPELHQVITWLTKNP